MPWVLLAVKTHQTATAAPALRALANGKTTIDVLQNGVEHRALTEPHAAGATIVPGIVGARPSGSRPERTIQRGPARVSVPDDDAGRAFATLMGEAAEVVTVPDFRTEAWRKLMLNATAAPMVTEARRAEVFREPEHLATAQALAEEAAEVARAEGAAIGPGDVEEVLATLTTMPPDLGTSMLFDRLAAAAWSGRRATASSPAAARARHRDAGHRRRLRPPRRAGRAVNKRLALVAAIMGSFVAGLDATVVNVALPAIRDDLGGGLAGQQWISNAYLLTLGSLILVGGSLGDIFGERRVFSIGVGGFGVRLAALRAGAERSRCWSPAARCRARSARC